MARALQFVFGFLILISIEFLKVYLIMPFGQSWDALDTAYFIHSNIFYFRTFAALLMVVPAIYYLRYGKWLSRILVVVALIFSGVMIYLLNFKFSADAMFYQPEQKLFAKTSTANQIRNEDLVVGVYLNGIAKAYPIELIGYHHQVRDTVGSTQIMVTYCTVCRTGRVFSPLVAGRTETFRLVGMDHYNAMFEDQTTGSWWQQATGEAVTGPLKGESLEEIPTEQMTLAAWLRQYPDSWIMQPDPRFKEDYDHLKSYDEGKSKGSLTRRDSLSWNEKSWVVGVTINEQSRAYDWNDVVSLRVVNDTLGRTPILITIESDSASFHIWKRDSLTFKWNSERALLQDEQTSSTWSWEGISTEGPLKGQRLTAVQSYQEFWHSWRTFRPKTSRYNNSR